MRGFCWTDLASWIAYHRQRNAKKSPVYPTVRYDIMESSPSFSPPSACELATLFFRNISTEIVREASMADRSSFLLFVLYTFPQAESIP